MSRTYHHQSHVPTTTKVTSHSKLTTAKVTKLLRQCFFSACRRETLKDSCWWDLPVCVFSCLVASHLLPHICHLRHVSFSPGLLQPRVCRIPRMKKEKLFLELRGKLIFHIGPAPFSLIWRAMKNIFSVAGVHFFICSRAPITALSTLEQVTATLNSTRGYSSWYFTVVLLITSSKLHVYGPKSISLQTFASRSTAQGPSRHEIAK